MDFFFFFLMNILHEEILKLQSATGIQLMNSAPLLAIWPCTNYLASLGLSFIICKEGKIAWILKDYC